MKINYVSTENQEKIGQDTDVGKEVTISVGQVKIF
jgi:hypothetical protein